MSDPADIVDSTGSRTVTAPAIDIIQPDDIYATVDEAMTTTPIQVIGATGQLYTVVGTLPDGLYLAEGKLNGTPTTAGTSVIQISVTDATGFVVTTEPITITVIDPLAVATYLQAAYAIGWTKNVDFEYQLYTAGGLTPFTWIIASGTFPTGLSMDTEGLITGTPTVASTQAMTFTVRDAQGTTATSATVTFTINDTLTITQGPVSFTEAATTCHSIIAVAGTPPHTFALDTGDVLPDGAVLMQDGSRAVVILGKIPVAAADQTVAVIVTDGAGATATTGNFLISVVP